MPRSKSLIRLSALVAFIALASGTSATAQDAKTVAEGAQTRLKEIQEKLAKGKGADDKDAPNLKQLRIDGFTEKAGKVAVAGVFLDTGEKPANKETESSDARFGDAAKQLVLAHLKVDKPVLFDWSTVDVYGSVDAAGKALGEAPPYVTLQAAANAAGAEKREADQVFLTGNRFGAGGELIVTGTWAKNPAGQQWLKDHWSDKVLADHPAARRKKGDKPNLNVAELTTRDPWPLTVPAARALLAGSKDDPALQRTRVDRVYLAYRGTVPRLVITGVRIGEDKLPGDAVREKLTGLWPEVLAKLASDTAPEILNDLVDPAPDVQAEVAKVRPLDGIRVDPGARFNADGDILLAGLRPDLTTEKRAQLSDAFQRGVKTRVAKGGASAKSYALLETSKVSAEAMKPVALTDLQNELRQWAIKNRDDVRFRRLFFVTDPKALERQTHAKVEGGYGLVLVYQVADQPEPKAVHAELAAVKEEFERAFKRHFPKEDALKPEPVASSAPDAPKTADPPKVELKKPAGLPEDLLPGLTAELRRTMAAGWNLPPEKNPWYGVMITRGYFDEDDQYRLAGFVDRDGQNADLRELLQKRKGETKWRSYFRDHNDKEQAVVVPKLQALSFTQMLVRVKRVTPAHPAFDGVRIEDAYYDENLKLVFKAHAVGPVAPDVVGKLADLLVRDPKYAPRVALPEQPTDPSAPRLPPKVGIRPVAGAAYPGEWTDAFSVGYGAQLLAKGDLVKAKEWLDVGILHYPNVSGVWFLSAYYNHLAGDTELVERDLKRVVDLEVLWFNGDNQRRTRYADAKDLQGPKRIALEDLWLIRYREVKDGAKPITLAGK